MVSRELTIQALSSNLTLGTPEGGIATVGQIVSKRLADSETRPRPIAMALDGNLGRLYAHHAPSLRNAARRLTARQACSPAPVSPSCREIER